jgi:hypothetical protein
MKNVNFNWKFKLTYISKLGINIIDGLMEVDLGPGGKRQLKIRQVSKTFKKLNYIRCYQI